MYMVWGWLLRITALSALAFCAPHYLHSFHYMQKYVVQRYEAQGSLSYHTSFINRTVILRRLRVRLSLTEGLLAETTA
jgi:hypothetical protein